MKAIEISKLKALICDLIQAEARTTKGRPETVQRDIGNFLTQFEIEINSKIKENAKELSKLIEEKDQAERAALKAAEQKESDSKIDDSPIK